MPIRQVMNPPPIHSKTIVWNNRITSPWQRWFSSVHELHVQYFPTLQSGTSQPSKPLFQMPSYTTAERDAMLGPRNGMQIYNSTTHEINWYRNNAWTNSPT